MDSDPKDILEHIGDKEYFKKLIRDADKPPSNAEANQTLTATLVYLAENIRRSGEASEQHAKSLKRATWMLFWATAALVAVAALQVFSAVKG